MNEYQAKAARTSDPGNPDRILYAAISVASEAGELLGAVKKWRYHKHELDIAHLIEEAGDVLWGIAELASALEITLQEIADANIAKLRRRYPDGFDVERSRNRKSEGEFVVTAPGTEGMKEMFAACRDAGLVDPRIPAPDFYEEARYIIDMEHEDAWTRDNADYLDAQVRLLNDRFAFLGFGRTGVLSFEGRPCTDVQFSGHDPNDVEVFALECCAGNWIVTYTVNGEERGRKVGIDPVELIVAAGKAS